MARFRHNDHQIVTECVYRADGLHVDRIQRFDQTALLSEMDYWRSWGFRITLSGTRYVTYNERAYSLAPSTVLWHSPLKEPLRMRWLPGTGSDTTVVTFTTQRWNAFLAKHATFVASNAALLAQPQLTLQFATPQLLHVLRHFIVLSQVSPAPSLALDNACRLLLQLLGEMQFGAAGQHLEKERRERVEMAQGRMVARLARPPSLSQIAYDLHVSSRQLQRDFRAFTGVTPVRYLTIVRMSEANHLLAETRIPIAQIAGLLGYVSQAHFSATFRQMYHCSPREVRGIFQKADVDPSLDPPDA